MPAALLDTNAVSDLMRDHPNVRARVGNYPDPVATSVWWLAKSAMA
jgi:predicted nucleic acid-binding protein